MTQKRVVVAMSGGVDSSVAAGLLVREGYEVIGITMRLWTEEDPGAARHHKRCCSVEDTDDARAAADVLGIRHYVLNLEREFKEDVVDHFVREYSRGRTPNPCLACNDKVKFRPLLERAVALGADYLATGHYARVRHSSTPDPQPSTLPVAVVKGPSPDQAELLQAVDPSKDQSYVLYTLGQDELRRTLFPVGEYPKDEIRRLAHEWRLPNADKPDSADICFIPSGDYRAFVRDRVPVAAGAIMDTSGRQVGEHDGVINYTVGQRRGVPARGNAEPLFVIDIDAADNRVVVGPQADLMATGLVADELSFISGRAPTGETPIQARIRYRSPAVPATLTLRNATVIDATPVDEAFQPRHDNANELPARLSSPAYRDGVAEVRFEKPQRAVTPGQAVVFYDGERVIGGGTIMGRLL